MMLKSSGSSITMSSHINDYYNCYYYKWIPAASRIGGICKYSSAAVMAAVALSLGSC